MLVKIHRNLRVFQPTTPTVTGAARKPFLGLRAPNGCTVNVYGGGRGVEALEELIKLLTEMAPPVGAEYIELEGIRPSDNGQGFIGFADELIPMAADPEDIAWAKALDKAALRRAVEGGVATQAREASSYRPAPAAGAAAPKINVDDLPF